METTAGERVHGVLATRSRPWVEHLGALGLYVGIMLALFGPKILSHLSDHLLAGAIDRGSINDASIYIWNLSWWPHAIGHAMNPFSTTAMWAPTGINLAGTTVIPLPSLVIAPVTLFFGPIVSFNLLSLLAPPTAAWTAYLLCRRIDAGFLPSVAGGFFFGFSSYEWLQTGGGHLNLSEIVFVPVCAYLVVRRLEGTIGPRAFTAGLTAALVAQFAISAEVFATMTIAGVLFGAIALVLNTRERRVQWYRTALLMVLSYLLALVVLSPYLYSLIARTQPVKPFPSLASWEARAPQLGSSLRQFVVPGPLTQIAHGLGERLGVVPSAWYLGIPLLAVVAVCFWRERRRTVTKVLGVTFAALIVLSLGPAVRVGGIQT